MASRRGASLLCLIPSVLLLCAATLAHGNHDQQPLAPDADWATRHMKEEHHVNNFDPMSFFALHDYDDDGVWEPSEIKATYGLYHESNANVSDADKDKAVAKVLELFDVDGDGFIDEEEFDQRSKQGKVLPDLGYGPGHHGDDEYEYDIHHFEKYHDENTREEDLTHPEDIEHFRKHDAMHAAEQRLEQQERLQVVEANIPMKFRKA